MKRSQDYRDMLAQYDLQVGDYVVCSYRMPPLMQPWLHPVWVGMIEDVDDDGRTGYGGNEANYCAMCKRVKVLYLTTDGNSSHRQYDRVFSLARIPWRTASFMAKDADHIEGLHEHVLGRRKVAA